MQERPFRHIYVERDVLHAQRTREILNHFPASQIVVIDHYKDVFNRRRQNSVLQHASQNLILAANRGNLLYPGAPVCQNFGNEHFYYTSCIMNCIYDCEYCFLKGMYPSGNLVIFVNLEDFFMQVEKLLEKFPVYLCISYDSDLASVESLTGYIRQWAQFTKEHENLTVEVRTKCGRKDLFGQIPVCDRFIWAFTVSPKEVIGEFEHGTGRLEDRIAAVAECMDAGAPVRLCFDPMIYRPGWQESNAAMMRELSARVDLGRVRDFSVGSFRISDSYLKVMRRLLPGSAVIQYPFEVTDGYYHYPDAVASQMEEFLAGEIRKRVPDADIFRWEN